MTVISLPVRPAVEEKLPQTPVDAAREWDDISETLEQLARQMHSLAARRRQLTAAALAHAVRQEHRTAATVIFAVKDAQPHRLYRVLDASGDILPARQTGRWAEEVLAILRSEDLARLGDQSGIETNASWLHVDLPDVHAAIYSSPGHPLPSAA